MAPLNTGNTISLSPNQFEAAFEAIAHHPDNSDLADLGPEISRGPVSSEAALGEPVKAIDFASKKEAYEDAQRELARQQELARVRNTGDRLEVIRNRKIGK